MPDRLIRVDDVAATGPAVKSFKDLKSVITLCNCADDMKVINSLQEKSDVQLCRQVF